MPVAIVDRLEAVEIEHAHCQRDVFLARVIQRLVEQVGKEGTVGQTGQHIVADPPLQRVQQAPFFADIEADRHIALDSASGLIEQGHNGAVDPIQGPILGPVADLALPDLAQGNGAPHGAEEFGRMQAGAKDPVIGAQQLFAAIAGNRTELVVDVSDPAGQVGLGKNSGCIHGPAVFLIHESGSLSLAVEPLDQGTEPGRDVWAFTLNIFAIPGRPGPLVRKYLLNRGDRHIQTHVKTP
ncbi:hypothetical protein EMIT051CA3_11249 [Pseudomonas chlororaphis]